jgi:hypothetical protein
MVVQNRPKMNEKAFMIIIVCAVYAIGKQKVT